MDEKERWYESYPPTQGNERDTHFAGFAKLLMPEIDILFASLYHAYATGNHEKRDVYSQRIETLIAQRAYDLLVHDRLNTGTSDLQHAGSSLDAEEMVNSIPDLTAWPDTQSGNP